MIRYSDDNAIHVLVEAMVGFFEVNPWNQDKPHADKTIPLMLDAVRQVFGDYARSVRITVH